MVDAARAEALLGQREALADAGLAADDVLERHPHVLVEDLGVAAGLAGRWSGSPIVGTSRRMFTPGVSVGTMIIENDL